MAKANKHNEEKQTISNLKLEVLAEAESARMPEVITEETPVPVLTTFRTQQNIPYATEAYLSNGLGLGRWQFPQGYVIGIVAEKDGGHITPLIYE